MTEQRSNSNMHAMEHGAGLPEYLDEKCENPLIDKEYSYDQALELTGNGKFQIATLFVTGVSIMAVITEGHCMAYVLPAAKCELQMSTAVQGFTNSVGYLGVMFASHFWGFMADTWGRRKVIRTTLLIAFVLSLISSISLNSWMLVIARFASGLSMAGVKGTVITYVGELMTNKNRIRYLAFVFSFMALGLTLQPLLGLAVLTRSFEWGFSDGWFIFKPWRMFLFINGLIACFGSLGMMLLPESPKFQLAMGKSKATLDIMRSMYAYNTGNSKDKFPVRSIAALDETGTNLSEVAGFKETMLLVWNQTMPLFYPPYLINMLMMCVSTFAISFVIHGQEFWLPQILSYYSKNINLPITICEAITLGRTAELSTRSITNALNGTTIPADLVSCNIIIDPITFKVTLTLGLCLLVLNISLGFIVNRFGTKSVLTWWLALNTISSLVIIWSNQFYVNNGFMIILVSANICCGVLASLYGDLFPTHLRAMAVNLIIMFGRLGSVLGINFVATMIFRFCDTLYNINFLLMLGAVLVTYFLFWKHRGVRSI